MQAQIFHTRSRVPELDALRGLAAAMVVFSHFDALWVWESKPVWIRQVLSSPLRVLVGGHEAVILFFLISGFALSVPYLQPQAPGYFSFLSKRIFRIYVPYLAALMLAIAGAAAFQGHVTNVSPGMPPWFEHTWSEPVDGGLVLRHIEFLGSYDNRQFNAAFWTLIHEMRISFVFPALFLAVRAMRARGTLALAAAMLAFTSLISGFGGGDGLATLHYVGLFLIGSLIAQHRDAIAEWYRRLDGSARVALGLSALILFIYGRAVETWGRWQVEDWATALGAAGVLIVAMNAAAASGFLRRPALQRLGSVSYSIYLVHLVVLLALVHGLPRWFPPAAVFALYVVFTAVTAWLFHAAVERPAMEAGRRAAAWMETVRAIPRLAVMRPR